jgi:hypothetical protein
MPKLRWVLCCLCLLQMTSVAISATEPPTPAPVAPTPGAPPAPTPPPATPPTPPAAADPAAAQSDAITKLQKLIEDAAKNTDKNETDCDMGIETCVPAVISLSGDQESTITLKNLPAGTYKIIATGSENFVDPVFDNDVMNIKDGEVPPKIVLVSLHLRKLFKTTYGATFGGTAEAMRRLRPEKANPSGPARNGLSLLVHGSLNDVKIEIFARPQGKDGPVVTKAVPVRVEYTKWEIDGGGFYAFSRLVDEQLVTEPVAATAATSPASARADTTGEQQVKVLRRDRSNRFRSDTGVSFNFYPANYPWVGFTFGIASNGDRSPSYFLGFGPRLLSLGRRAAVAATLGMELVQIQTFPGVSSDQVLPANSPLLAGKIEYEKTPYFSIHLGFSVGGPNKGVNP